MEEFPVGGDEILPVGIAVADETPVDPEDEANKKNVGKGKVKETVDAKPVGKRSFRPR